MEYFMTQERWRAEKNLRVWQVEARSKVTGRKKKKG